MKHSRYSDFTDKHPVLTAAVAALALNILIEILTRRSFGGAFRYFAQKPATALINALIVFITFLPSLFVRRRRFARILAAAVWTGFSIANFIMKKYRTTPVSWADFATLPSVWSIMRVYLSVFQMILILVAFAAAIGALVWAGIRTKKQERLALKTPLIATAAAVLLCLAFNLGGHLTGAFPVASENLAECFDDYGYAWTFTMSIFDRGIRKPDGYSEEYIEDIVEDTFGKNAEAEKARGAGKKPNVIFLQLESFFDVSHLKNVGASADPTPVFNALKSRCPSGVLTVPVSGAGTVNTEFEVLTGMSLDFFGTGEYPYVTVLKDQTCESMAYNLKEQGYATRAIHNNDATFYHRDLVFPNLGFDAFTSIEYMTNAEENPVGWIRDGVLTDEITDALAATEEPDFLYTITVEPHGRYPEEPLENYDYRFRSTGIDDDTLRAEYDYYLNELNGTDEFIRALISRLSVFSEPTVVVMFGDHLPSLELTPEELDTGSIFETEYVIWSNFGLTADDRDLESHQLSAYVTGLLGYDNGSITKLNQYYLENGDSAEYHEALEALQYDILYGDKEIYDGENPYLPTVLTMGTKEVHVESAEQKGEVFFIHGENFTPYSKVYVNDEPADSFYIDENILLVTGELPEHGDVLFVVQLAENETELSKSHGFPIE